MSGDAFRGIGKAFSDFFGFKNGGVVPAKNGLNNIFNRLTEEQQRQLLTPIKETWHYDERTKLAKNGFSTGLRLQPIADPYDYELAKNGFWDPLNTPIKETWNADGMDGTIKLSKNGKMNSLEKPKEHKMIKHSSPLAQNEHGLFQHNLYSTVQHIGFGIKTYV
jgi:hypothetical protein